MRNIAVVVSLILMLATASYAGEIFRYVTTDGTVSFTDDANKIPHMYRDTAETVVFEGEFKNFDRLSIVTMDPITKPITGPAPLIPAKLVNREFDRALISCTGHVTVTSERHQFGDFNRTVYLSYDECGKLVSVTFDRPEVRINR